LWNHKGCTYRAPVWYVTKTWSVFLLNKKNTHTPISSALCMIRCKSPTIILNNPVFFFQVTISISTVVKKKRTPIYWDWTKSTWRNKWLKHSEEDRESYVMWWFIICALQ